MVSNNCQYFCFGSVSIVLCRYLDGLEANEHVVLQPVESGVETSCTQLVQPPTNQADCRVFLRNYFTG